MILALCMPVFAADVEVPVTAVFREVTDLGEDPAVVDAIRSATVAVSDPSTGTSLTTRGELFAATRVGRGTGEVSFGASTNGTLHTWAIYLLDAHGNRLVAEPQVVDVLFGAGGDGTITARQEADIVIKQVKIKKKNVPARLDDGDSELVVQVQGLGIEAAYVGIQELAADGAPLQAHVDMESMTAEIYATYQGLALDAIVPVDEWATRMEGTITVEGVWVEGGQLQGNADLDYTVTLLGTAKKGESSVLGTYTVPEYVGLEAEAGEDLTAAVIAARPVTLDSNDRAIDSYDGGIDVIVAGDARQLELAAAWTGTGAAIEPTSPDLLTFDPLSAAVTAKGLGTVKYPSEDSYSGFLLAVQPTGKDGKALADTRLCTLEVSAGSKYGGTLSYIGECERNSAGLFDTSAITAQITRSGALTVSVAFDSLALQSATGASFTLTGATGASVWSGKGTAAITSTTFALDWTFAEPPAGEAASLELYFYGTQAPQTVTLASAGLVTFQAPRSTWSSGSDNTGVYAKDIIILRDIRCTMDKVEVCVDVDVK